MIFQLAIFIVGFSILNRIRGGWLFDDYKYFNTNWVIALFFGAIPYVVSGNAWFILAGAVAYLLGESDGWGAWIGTICYGGDSSRNEVEGIWQNWFGLNIGRVISPIDYYTECIINLAIRGVQWWALYAIVLAFAGVDATACVLFALVLGSAMPLAYVLARDWELGEVYYGAMQGMALFLIWSLRC